MVILEFQNRIAAENAEATIFNALKTRATKKGDAIQSDKIIGKRNGVNDSTAQMTERWDIVKKSPDGTLYIESPSAELRESVRGQLPFDGLEKEFPTAWIPVDVY